MTTPDASSSSSTTVKKTVLAFDLYGTLLSTSSISSALASHFGPARAAELATSWRTQQLEYTWRLNSMGQYQPFTTVTRNSLLAVLAAEGLSLDAKDLDAVLGEYTNLHVFPDAVPALESLRQETGLESWIFTNGTEESVSVSLTGGDNGLGRYADVFAGVVTVEEVRRFKPCAEVYWHLLTKIGKQREQAGEVWLVSGNAFDVVGAKCLGLKAVWVDREGKGWSDRCCEGKGPDLIVRGLGEVVDGVKRLR